MRFAFFAFVLASACGGKIDGSVEGGLPDAASSIDAKSDPPPTIKDAGLVVDATVGCTKATVQVALASDGCKMGADWTCNGHSYRGGGACSQLNGLTGSCSDNGVPTKMITTPSCNCQDPQIAQMYAKLCGFPPPP